MIRTRREKARYIVADTDFLLVATATLQAQYSDLIRMHGHESDKYQKSKSP